MSKSKVVIFIHDGIVEGAFRSDDDVEVVISDFDRCRDDQSQEDAFWKKCGEEGLKQFTPCIQHYEVDEEAFPEGLRAVRSANFFTWFKVVTNPGAPNSMAHKATLSQRSDDKKYFIFKDQYNLEIRCTADNYGVTWIAEEIGEKI